MHQEPKVMTIEQLAASLVVLMAQVRVLLESNKPEEGRDAYWEMETVYNRLVTAVNQYKVKPSEAVWAGTTEGLKNQAKLWEQERLLLMDLYRRRVLGGSDHSHHVRTIDPKLQQWLIIHEF